jgi:hypothetical protein
MRERAYLLGGDPLSGGPVGAGGHLTDLAVLLEPGSGNRADTLAYIDLSQATLIANKALDQKSIRIRTIR